MFTKHSKDDIIITLDKEKRRDNFNEINKKISNNNINTSNSIIYMW